MGPKQVDEQVMNWANTHHLRSSVSLVGKGSWNFYVSSKSGECFQIWIESGSDDIFRICAACVEGRKENDLPEEWPAVADEVGKALESAFQTVLKWMSPSERHFPNLHPVERPS